MTHKNKKKPILVCLCGNSLQSRFRRSPKHVKDEWWYICESCNLGAPESLYTQNFLKKPQGLLLTPFPSKRFMVTSTSKTEISPTVLCAEAAELMDDNGRDQHLDQLYDDSDDFGLAIRSEGTGDITVYRVCDSERNSLGEIDTWIYRPTPDSVQRVPECKNTIVKVFND